MDLDSWAPQAHSALAALNIIRRYRRIPCHHQTPWTVVQFKVFCRSGPSSELGRRVLRRNFRHVVKFGYGHAFPPHYRAYWGCRTHVGQKKWTLGCLALLRLAVALEMPQKIAKSSQIRQSIVNKAKD